jgi:hypothetical protein
MLSDNTMIGIWMVSLGLLFLFLGVLFLFDSGLLAIGNVLFLAGITAIIGVRSTANFFNPWRRPDRVRGILCFFGGIALVLVRWPVIGMVVEVVGMVQMFGPFLRTIVDFLRGVPIVGPLLSAPIVGRIVDKLAGGSRRAPV